ncbi:NADH dehydrogenase [ubiquinone] 1 alpha subcomplex subunit 3 [Plecturocebus cupreus]
MASRLGAFLKNAWAKEPVLVVSFFIGTLGAPHVSVLGSHRYLHLTPTKKSFKPSYLEKGSQAIVLPPISPYFKYSVMINEATPYNYPGPGDVLVSVAPSCPTVPVRDDGNMPDIPSHPQDPQGPSLEWLKNL